MATSAGGTQTGPRPEDGLGRIVYSGDRLLRPVESALNFVAAIAVMFLMVLGVVQIILRIRQLCVPWTDLCVAGINSPMFGYIDMIQLAMPILAVLGISYAQRYGVHIRMDIVIERLRGPDAVGDRDLQLSRDARHRPAADPLRLGLLP